MVLTREDDAQDVGRAKKVWRAGRVARWHANPDLSGSGDSVDGHSGRMAALAVALFPDLSVDLMTAIATHDLGEHGVGDVSADAKRADLELKVALDRREAAVLRDMGLPPIDLGERDARRLKLLDRLDAYLWMLHRAPWLDVRKDWQGDLKWLLAEAEALGVGAAVLGAVA